MGDSQEGLRIIFERIDHGSKDRLICLTSRDCHDVISHFYIVTDLWFFIRDRWIGCGLECESS